MAWTMSTGVDVSHYQMITDYDRARAAVSFVQIKLTESTGWIDSEAKTHHAGFVGVQRGAYHFARPAVSIRDQVAHFLARKVAIGPWERLDALDAEVSGTTGPFIKELIAEYRRQSGRHRVIVYSPVDPSGWWDEGCVIWRARYRKIGDPGYGDNWPKHLGWDHPGLGIYQWDDAWPLPGGPVCDVNSQRIPLADTSSEGATMALTGADADVILDRPRPRADTGVNTSIGAIMVNWDASRIQAYNHRNAIQATQQAHGSTLAQILTLVGGTPEGLTAEDMWAKVEAAAAEAAHQGAKDAVTADQVQRLQELHDLLEADNADQAKQSARALLTELRASLPE